MGDNVGCDNFFINFSDIVNYVGAGVRSYEEGEQVFKANHVMFCGIISTTQNITNLVALCLSSSALFDKPHEIKVNLSRVNFKLKIECLCSCPAGQSGKCKHCVGVLMYLNRVSVSSIQEATCTDLKQEWGKLKSDVNEMYKTEPLSKFCHFQKSYKRRRLVQYEEKKGVDFLSILNKDLDPPNELMKVLEGTRSTMNQCTGNQSLSEVRRIVKNLLSVEIYPAIKETSVLYKCNRKNINYNSLSTAEKNFYETKVKKNRDSAIELCINTIFQNNYLWKEERKYRITASNAYSLVTYVKNKNPDWHSKIGKYINNTFTGSADTRHGILMEANAHACYENCTDFTVIELGLLVNPNIPWLGYSPDGIVENKLIIEIKSSKIGKKLSAKDALSQLSYLQISDDEVTLKKKHQYYCQVQLGMFITNLQMCHFIIYCSFDNSCFIVEVPYDKLELQNNYIPILSFVYFRFMLKALVSNKKLLKNESKENCDDNDNRNESV